MVRVRGFQKLRLNPVWHRMLYSCTHMATVGVKRVNEDSVNYNLQQTTVHCTCPYERLLICTSGRVVERWTCVHTFLTSVSLTQDFLTLKQSPI